MDCPTCGTRSPEAARFCMGCGAALAATCPACGQSNPPGARFCIACGGALTGQGAASAAPTVAVEPPTSPIRGAEAELEAERKQVTVLFADIVGSTGLIDDRDEEAAHRLFSGALRVMMDAVHQFGGTVSRNMGDGLLALFGAPVAHEDHAVRACYAALAIQEGMKRYGDQIRSRIGADVRVRVGLNSGGVVVQLLSDDRHSDYSAMGRTVHLAARMEQSAAPGTTRLTAETLGLAEGHVNARSLGREPVRGFAEPVEIFKLLSADPHQTRLRAAAARGLTRFVGREAETLVLRAAMERAEAGLGQIVSLIGEPGVGKSRLVLEATRVLAGNGMTSGRPEAGWLVLECGALSYGTSTAYLPIVSLLKLWSGVDASDDPSAAEQKVVERLRSLDPALESMRAPLLALLDISVEDPAWGALDPPRRRRQTIDAVKRLLVRQSQERPLLLVFEDLHWLDVESQALLDELVESLPTLRVFLLVTYRPEYRHERGGKSFFTQVRVDALASSSAAELLASLLGDDPALVALKRHLIEHTDGNPFFLEESVRALVETNALAGEPGAYRLTRELPGLRVPATVQAVLAARIDRLAPADKRLLQTAAVVGKDVPLALLQAVTGLSEEDLRAGIGRLRAAELIYEVRLFPEPEYTFKHALTHDVAYGSLLLERRRELHARIVEAIEAHYPDRLDEHVERLAHHALRGEIWEKAVDHCRRAGRRDLMRSALQEAGSWFEQGLVALRRLPESQEALEQRIDLAIELRNAINPLGEFHRAYDFLQEAERLAEQIGDQARLGRVYISMNSYLYLTGQPRQALAMNRRAFQIARDLGDAVLEAAVWGVLGSSQMWLGEYRQACAAHRTTLAMVAEASERGRMLLGNSQLLAVAAHGQLSWCLAELGAFPEALEHGKTAVRMAMAADHTFSQIGTSHQTGLARVRRGDLKEAIELLERGLEISRVSGIRTLNYFGVASRLGETYVAAGRLADAIPLLEDVVDRGRELGAISDYLLAMGPLAEAYAELGRHPEALTLAVDAVQLASTHEFRGLEAHALRYLGALHARVELFDVEISERSFRQALTLAEGLGMRPLQTRCRLGLGKLLRRVGRQEEARAELWRANEMLREMGMAFWLPEVEAELAVASTA